MVLIRKKKSEASSDCRLFVADCLQVYCRFLVACTQLYTSLCRSVVLSVCPSVRPKSLSFFRRLEFNRDQIRALLRLESYCPCPTTILPLPTRTQLMLPCIRPCSQLNLKNRTLHVVVVIVIVIVVVYLVRR